MAAPRDDTFPGRRQPIGRRSHPLVEAFRDAARGADRQRMLLDGEHLVEAALDAGCPLDAVAATWPVEAGSHARVLAARAAAAGVTVSAVSRRVMDALSPARTPGDIVALALRPAHDLDTALGGHAPLVVVACDVQDPGNVGAIVRSADACGATAVLCAGDCADPFGWKALRGSMGSALRLPVVTERRLDLVAGILAERGLAVVAAAGGHGALPHAIDWRGPTALLVGNEGAGLPPDLLAAGARVAIPMRAGVESLNVAVATGILLYEASRQRGGR